MVSVAKGRRTRKSSPNRRWYRPHLTTRTRIALGVLAVFVLMASLVFADWWTTIPERQQPSFVGGSRCIECHQQEAEQWRGSHHDLAMQRATPDTVLGDFDNASLTYHGITARMFRRDGQFYVHTEGPDGTMQDFLVKYVFGVAPLQQYMVEFDRPPDMPEHEVARLQVLRESWDTEKQQWFYLPPPDVSERLRPDDALHWTGVAQRWNNMCADCHSTNLRKNFDVSAETYHTTFTDIDVNCEACHGPGSLHIELANSYSLFWDRKRGYGLADLKASAEQEIQACAPCHARRRVLQEGYPAGSDYYDYFATDPPHPSTYFADGQILDEVYEHGSFLQSKMYHRQIRCSDCHEPHSARLKHSGNQVCTSCHQHPAGKYDTAAHHHHPPGSTGASCVECHMPETTYMEVDERRDHSLRVPSPEMSVQYGTPNACTRCHLERAPLDPEQRKPLKQYRDWVIAARTDPAVKSALAEVDEWAAQAVQRWYGSSRSPRPAESAGEMLAQIWRNDERSSDAALKLLRQTAQPAILRASALQWLASSPSEPARDAAQRALADPHPLVRAAAAEFFEGLIPAAQDVGGLPPDQMLAVYAPLRPTLEALVLLLDDPTTLVRIGAARVLARVPPRALARVARGPQREQLERALDELVASWQGQNDRAGGHAARANLHELRGDEREAEAAYRTAIQVEPEVAGPRSNLATLLERRVTEALRGGADQAAVTPLATEIQQLRSEELALIERDAGLLPDNAELQYRLGLVRHLNGQTKEAVPAVRRAHELQPRQAQFVLTLALLHQRLEQFDDALEYARLLVELEPHLPSHRELLNQLRSQARQTP